MTQAQPIQEDDAVYLSREIKRTDAPNHATVRHQEVVSVDEQIALLKALVHADEEAEKKAKTLLTVGIIGGVLVFVGWMFFTGLLLLPVVIGIFIWRHNVLKSDMDDRKLDAALRPLLVLKDDLKRNKACLVDVDFHAYEQLSPADNRTEGGGMFTAGVEHRRWEHEWLKMELPLLDGSVAQVSVQTQAKRKSRRKRKYTKHKERLHELLRIRLRLPTPLEPSEAAALQDRLTSVATGPERVRGARVSGNKVEVAFAMPAAGRQRLRNGWSGQGLDNLVDGNAVVRALARTVRATQAARTR